MKARACISILKNETEDVMCKYDDIVKVFYNFIGASLEMKQDNNQLWILTSRGKDLVLSLHKEETYAGQ